MKALRRTMMTFTVTLFSLALFAFVTVMFAAACSNKVTLSFETFGGTRIEAISLTAGSSVSVPENPQKEGYVFEGWYLTRECSGESTQIPSEMPEASVTYYAKFAQYPTLSLALCGGETECSSFYVKEATQILSVVEEVIPRKEGLLFDCWLLDGQPLTGDELMTEEDVTLTAHYLAAYRVETYLQRADSAEDFVLEESISGTAAEGSALCPQIPVYEHFLLDETRSEEKIAALSAGENVIRFYFLREKVSVSYVQTDGEQTQEEYFFGGSVTLPAGADPEDGVFFGWATEEGMPAAYLAGERLTLGAEDVTLYASRGKAYADGRAQCGRLFIESALHGDGLQSVRSDDLLATGEYSAATGFFTIDGREGRLDGRGYYLFSDSGSYAGYSLRTNRADRTQYGTLTLDFSTGEGVFECGGTRAEGTYTYLFSEETQGYTGQYSFASEDSFLFLLMGESFLREGEEKATYYEYDCFGGTCDDALSIFLDGFGNAVRTGADGGRSEYTYCGGGEDEWLLTGTDGTLRILTGECGPSFGGNSRPAKVYLLYRSHLAGSFIADGETLILDGYGFSAVYNGKDTRREGVFTVDGDEVRLRTGGRIYCFLIDRAAGSFLVKTVG